MPIKDLSGQRFGRLLVVSHHGLDKRGGATWLCKCECGKDFITRARTLSSGEALSCGCLHKERITKHGMLNSPTYKSWRAMMERCNNPKSSGYHRYGGRGISYCESWGDFRNFLADMGVRPKGCTLDRIDNNSDYFKENCKWSSPRQQSRNRCTNKFVDTEFGRLCLRDAADKYGIKYNAFHERIKRGWSIEKALKTPTQKRSK